MTIELALTPTGRLRLDPGTVTSSAAPAWQVRIIDALRDDAQAAGLFACAVAAPDTASPSLTFWRDLACHWLNARCRAPEGGDGVLAALPAPADELLQRWRLAAPPMSGGEYLSEAVLRAVWLDLDDWLRATLARETIAFDAWLATHAPRWHQVGRVCLHLAEDPRDADRPFAFLATYALRLSGAGRVQYRPLGRALQDHADDRHALTRLLEPLRRASAGSTVIAGLVDSGDIFHALAWTPAEAYRLLSEAPALEDSGLLLRLPDWWHRRTRAQATVTIGSSTRLDRNALLDFRLEVTLDGEALTADELRQLMASDAGLLRLRGRWVEADRERLEQALAHWRRVEREAGDGIDFIAGMRLLAGAAADLGGGAPAEASAEWSQVVAGRGLATQLAALRAPPPVDAGAAALCGTLRPYQAHGRDWLYQLTRLGLGACLADDMGLGKTLQVLALLLALRAERGAADPPSLLILPASLLGNWKAEIERFAPGLRVCFVHPAETPRAALTALASAPDEALAEVDLVITSYAMLARQEWLLGRDWRLVILDEAQLIKNPAARQTRAVKRLRATARIALTGTPVENRLGDLWSLFDFLCPGLLGSAQRFGRFIKALEAREDERYAPLRRLVGPYILRRLKTDRSIIGDLPDKTEVKAWCGLSRRQAALYASAVRDLAQSLQNDRDGMQRRGQILTTLMRLKQICNHPAQLTGDGDYRPQDSGKFARLTEIAAELAARQERLLVFTQFRDITEPLSALLAEVFGRAGLVLHGATAVRQRRALVEDFQRDDGPPFMVLSLKAGGVGLNLTAASQVLHFDRWWNPAVEDQATDRAFRIGQRRNVMVHKMVCRGTAEERIDTLIEARRRLAGDVIGGAGETLLTELDDATLLATLSLDIERASI